MIRHVHTGLTAANGSSAARRHGVKRKYGWTIGALALCWIVGLLAGPSHVP